MSDGMQTSGFNTPDVSRPGTPEELPNIPLGEKDGLPLPSSSKRGRTFTREAAKLVAIHKAKTMFKSKRKGDGHKREGSSGSAPRDPRSSSEPLRASKNAARDDSLPSELSRNPTAGGGVLSALLKLYEQPQSERSSQATLVPSAAGTPPEGAPTFARAGPHQTPGDPSSTAAFANEVRRRSNIQLGNMFSGTSAKVDNNSNAWQRPPTPSQQGGLFGALQQSNAVLTGAASPYASNAATPPLKRPSPTLEYVTIYAEYKLNRHPLILLPCSRRSLPEVPTMASLAGQSTDRPPSLFMSDSRQTSPERPLNIRRKTGSTLALNQLAKVPEQIARSGEKLARESLDPKRYHRESAALKAAKSRDNSPSTPGTPKYEFDEKTPVRRRKKDKKRQEEIFITSRLS